MANSVTPDNVDVFLENTAWAICSTYHTVLKASPGAAIFGCDMLFNIPFVADWHKFGEQRQSLTNRGNQHKNAKCIDYDYKVKDKVLLIFEGILRKAESAYGKAPWTYHYSSYKWNYQDSTRNQNGTTVEYNHLQMIFYKLDVGTISSNQSSFSYSHKILRFFDSNNILTSSMTSRIVRVNFFRIKVFSARFSRLIASFVGADVIGNGIMVGNITH
jgi:hypothetical protein